MASAAADHTSAVSFIDSIGDACMVVDRSFAIAASNKAADSLYRPGADGLVGTSVLDWCPAQQRDEFLAAMASCNGTPATFSGTQMRGDGTAFLADISAARCHHHVEPAVTLIVRERTDTALSCHDDIALRDVALDNSLDGIIVHSLEGRLLFANRAAITQWGISDPADVLTGGPFGWVPPAEQPVMRRRLSELRDSGEARFDMRTRVANGVESHLEIHARLVDTVKGPLVVSTVRDVTERIQTEEMVRYLAYHDMLTGLANRVQLGQELSHEVAAADRHGDTLGVIFIDLNDFKPVNDTYGHTIGDHVLREVADRLAGSVREIDTVARLGGDEFVVVLPRLASPDDLPRIAEELSKEISRPIVTGRQEVTVRATLGMAIHLRGEDADSLLIRADLAMYDARDKKVAGWELFAQ